MSLDEGCSVILFAERQWSGKDRCKVFTEQPTSGCKVYNTEILVGQTFCPTLLEARDRSSASLVHGYTRALTRAESERGRRGSCTVDCPMDHTDLVAMAHTLNMTLQTYVTHRHVHT